MFSHEKLEDGAGNIKSSGCTCSRRSLLVALAGVAVAGIVPKTVQARREEIFIHGKLCSLAMAGDGGRVEIDSRTGDSTLDGQLVAEARGTANALNVWPGLAVIVAPPSRSSNAFAVSKTYISGTKGTVFLGRDIVFSTLDKNASGWGGLAVAGIMAHEFAHIFQMFHGYDRQLKLPSGSVEMVELHADFLAGYRLGLKRRDGQPTDIKAFIDTAYFLGDFNETSRGHHGLPEERRLAVREGYRVGVQESRSVREAADIGLEVVSGIARS